MANSVPYRISKDYLGQVSEYAEAIGYSEPQFVGECVKAICGLVGQEDPDIPKIVRLIEAANSIPTKFVGSSSAGEKLKASHPAVKDLVKHAKRKAAQTKTGKSALKR